MPRFLHTADWQIGRLYGGFEPDDAVPLAQARLAAVERIATVAARERVDAVLVAGDVFDAQTVSARSIRQLFNSLEAFDGPWILIPGNHDAALAEGVWTHAQRLAAIPPRVQVALEPRTIELPACSTALLCAPLTQRHTHDDLTAWFDGHATPPGWCRIGLAHGAVQGLLAEDIDSANPIAPDRSARAHLDYLALGDWHGTKRIDDRTWYSGTPEPDRFRANEAGQVLRVEIEAPGATPRVTPLPIGQYRWQQLAPTLGVPSDLDALLATLAGLQDRDVVDLAVAGVLDLAGHARLTAALGEAQARVRCLRQDLSSLRLAPTEADIAGLQADGYLAEVIADLRDTKGEQARRAQDALALLADLLAQRGAPGRTA